MKKINASEMRKVNGGGWYYCKVCKKSFWAAGDFGVGLHGINNGLKKHYKGSVYKIL